MGNSCGHLEGGDSKDETSGVVVWGLHPSPISQLLATLDFKYSKRLSNDYQSISNPHPTRAIFLA